MVTTNYNYINILIYILMIIKQFIHLTLGKGKHHCPHDPPGFLCHFSNLFWIWIFV